MAKYEVNRDGVSQARKLIDDGMVDSSIEWSTAAPSTDEENRLRRILVPEFSAPSAD